MKPIPLYDATAPIACTIAAEEIPGRVELIERIRDQLDRVERTDHGLLLTFAADPEVEADLRRFAVDEKRCCQFWGFAVTAAGDDLALRWDGPPAAAELLDQILAWFEGEEPLAGLAGLF